MITNLKVNAKKIEAVFAALCVLSTTSCVDKEKEVAGKPTNTDAISVISNEETTLRPDVTTDRTTDKIVGETTDNETTYTTILTDKGETIVSDVENVTTVGSNTKKDESTSRGTVVDNTESNDITSNTTTRKTTVITTPSKTTSSTTRKTTVKTTAPTTRKTTPETTKSSSSTATTTTTTKPITTTTTTTEEPIVTELVSQDYSLEDIFNDAGAFRYYAEQIMHDLIPPSGAMIDAIELSYGITTGAYESCFILYLLNPDVSDAVLRNVFADYPEDKFDNLQIFVNSIRRILDGRYFDWSKYCYDQQLGCDLCNLENSFYDDSFYEFVSDNFVNGYLGAIYSGNPTYETMIRCYDVFGDYLVYGNSIVPLMDHLHDVAYGSSYSLNI